MNKFKQPLLIFDPKCSLCLRIKRLLQLVDRQKKLTLVSLYTPGLFETYDNLSFDECYGKVHLIDENDGVHVGGQAVEYLLNNLSPFDKLAPLWEQKAVRMALAFLYEILNTYRLKKSPDCETCRL